MGLYPPLRRSSGGRLQQTGEHRNPMRGGRCCETDEGFLAAEHGGPVTEIVSVLGDVTKRRFCLSSKADGCRPALTGARLDNMPFAATFNTSTV